MTTLALTFLGGAPFQLLYDGIKMAIRKSNKFRNHLENLESTLVCLQPWIIQQIRANNVQLNLPNHLIQDLELKMEEGKELVYRLSRLGVWNIHIWGNCYNCIKPNYRDQLAEIDRSLRILLEILKLEEMRNVQENLILSRNQTDRQDELDKKLSELLKVHQEVLKAQQEMCDMMRVQHEAVYQEMQRIRADAVQNVRETAPVPAPALKMVFQVLCDVVVQAKVKNTMCKRLLQELKSTVDFLKPLIEEMAESNKLLHLSEQEQEKFIVQMRKGVELIANCSKVSKWHSFKKYACTNELLKLDEYLRGLFLKMSMQIASHVKEGLISICSMEEIIKKIEESGVVQKQIQVVLTKPQPALHEIEIEGLSEVAETSSPITALEVQEPKDINHESLDTERMYMAQTKQSQGSRVVEAQSQQHQGIGNPGAGERLQDDGPDYTVFVGDLAADVTDYTLHETFRAHYHSVKGANVVTDRITGRSNGYGFVRFGDESEQLRAMNEMNGQFCSSRPMRIEPAATKKPVGAGQPYQKGLCPWPSFHPMLLSEIHLKLNPQHCLLHTQITQTSVSRRISSSDKSSQSKIEDESDPLETKDQGATNNTLGYTPSWSAPSSVNVDGQSGACHSIGETGSIPEKQGGTDRVAFRTKSESTFLDDGFNWRKYGKKLTKNNPHPRNYYKCAYAGCPVKKRVERDGQDPSYVITTYQGVHSQHNLEALVKGPREYQPITLDWPQSMHVAQTKQGQGTRAVEAQSQQLTAYHGIDNSVNVQALEPSSLYLIFPKGLSLPIFTASKISDEDNNQIQILVVDINMINNSSSCHQMVPISLPHPVKIEIVVLDGDFPGGERENWTSKEFDSRVLKERTGKRPLLTGDVNITVRDGPAMIGDIEFTDNSSWIRSRKFRLGARVAPGTGYQGMRIREAITDAFVVKDHRGDLYKKHYPPMLEDEVWRLEKIGKDGAFHKKLAADYIFTVQDFLKMLVVDKLKLKQILGIGMSEKMWEVTVKHATTCEMGNKLYIYRGPHFELFLSPTCEVMKAVINGQTFLARDLSNYNKIYIESLVRQAHANWNTLEVVDTLVNHAWEYSLTYSRSGSTLSSGNDCKSIGGSSSSDQ